MTVSDRGSKHICPDCGVKYYDLNKDVIACPKCGAKPAPPKVRKASQPARKLGRSAFGRYPN